MLLHSHEPYILYYWSPAWEIAPSSVELPGVGNQCGLQDKLKIDVA